MKFNPAQLPAQVSLAWRRLARRDQQALSALALVVLGALAFVGMWQPAQLRLATAEHRYQQQVALAAELSRAQRPTARALDSRPLPVQLSERALADGLDLQQLEVQDDILRLTLSGDAGALLTWLYHTESSGAVMQSLSLDKRDERLEATLVIQAPATQ